MNYIEDAHRTSAPVEPVMHRLAEHPQSLTGLFYILHGIVAFSEALDKWKAWAYYGKNTPPLPPSARELSIEMPLTGLEAALEFIEDMHSLELLHAIIGDASESGELAKAIIPALFEGKALDVVNMHEEVGDKLWYLAKLLRFTGSDFETVMRKNIDKLRARYPQKFTEEAAQSRDLAAERSALEENHEKQLTPDS